MPTNKNAQLRYKILDRCFSNFKHKYTIDITFKNLDEEQNYNQGKSFSGIVNVKDSN